MAKTDPEPDLDPAEIVPIRNRDLPESAPGKVTREAFEQVWKAKGFEIVDNDGAFIGTAPAKTPAGGAS